MRMSLILKRQPIERSTSLQFTKGQYHFKPTMGPCSNLTSLKVSVLNYEYIWSDLVFNVTRYKHYTARYMTRYKWHLPFSHRKRYVTHITSDLYRIDTGILFT